MELVDHQSSSLIKTVQSMQAHSNSASPEGLRKRLMAIVDHHMKKIAEQLQKEKRKVVVFNQALLEEWSQMLQRIVFLKDARPPVAKSIPHQEKNQMPNIRYFPNPAQPPQQINQKCLLSINANHCKIFQVTDSNKMTVTHTELAFPKGYLRKYCSYNFITPEKALLVGGSRQSNPNLKSKQVSSLNISSGEVEKWAEMPYGVSSHSAVKIKQHVYVIGGNKDMNTVTKSCLSINIHTKEIKEIASLNYPSASHTSLSWKQKFIYKFGGIGSCFGSWDLSPYIQRYCLAQDLWQIINPILKVDEGLFDHYSLLANSLAFACRDRIIIFGGFDFSFRGSNKLMQMTIEQDHHQITNIGTVQGMEVGGFFQQEPLILGNALFAIHSLDNPKQGLQQRVIHLSNQARYC